MQHGKVTARSGGGGIESSRRLSAAFVEQDTSLSRWRACVLSLSQIVSIARLLALIRRTTSDIFDNFSSNFYSLRQKQTLFSFSSRSANNKPIHC